MNNGNVLNSLLGITSANSAATKTPPVKTRAESSEKFQRALEQARPEVAARKPVARKASAANEAPAAASVTTKPGLRHHSQPETNRADSRSKAEQDESGVASNAREAPQASTPDADQTNSQAVEAQVQPLSEQTETLLVVGAPVIDPALVIADESGELLLAPEALLNSGTQPLELEGTANNEEADEADITARLNPDSSPVLPELNLSPLAAAVAAEESTASPAGTLSPLTATNPVPAGQVAPGLVTGTQLAAGQPVIAQGVLADDLGDKLILGPAAEAGDAEGDLPGDAGSGENPDFLLLNSKAALNKLTEANMAAPTQDKAAPTDAAKLAASGAALESFTRLTENQSPAARAFVVQTGVPVTVGTPQWSQAVGDKVLWLAAQNVTAAEIRLDPPELGPMQVKVSINQEQASVTFTSPHPAVREALDQQLNRLREMFSEQGLNLVNVDVSDKSFAQQEREQQESAKNQANAQLDEEELVPVGLSQALSMRLVDHYA